jgi:very-short-patch-repair endonuclease
MRASNLSQKRAKALRRAMSPPEVRAWQRLRARQPGGLTFRRQHAIGPFILDFYCAQARLAVEIDGWGHNMGDQPERDARRDKWLEQQGIATLRLTAAEVLADPDQAADQIWRTARARAAGELD